MASLESGKPGNKDRRDRGMVLFVVKYGVLGWGVTSGAAYFLMELARKDPDLGKHAIYAATVFPAIGLAAGIMLWHFRGKKKKM
jgi:hypothetical protein